jgi:fatty acid desaturase
MQNVEYLGDTQLYPRAKYARELRPGLPDSAFEPARSRLAMLPIALGIAIVAMTAIAKGWLPWMVTPLLSIVIGVSFACMTFVCHEAMHGGIVRGKKLQHLIGWIGFMPFMLSPRLWVAWHNRAHHADTNLPNDPDAYPTLERYRARASTRFSADMFSLGGRRWRGGLSLILGFTVQSADQLFGAKSNGTLSRSENKLAFVEAGLGVVVWGLVAAVVGFVPFLFVYVLPLLIANACVMAFILTNHSLSPRVTLNDPLISGLTVTTSPFVQRLTLGFGFHVEHHLFPAMSTRHAHLVRDLVLAKWPERYQSMSLREALRQLHRTARVYKNSTTLLDPKSGREFPTLLPRALAVSEAAI